MSCSWSDLKLIVKWRDKYEDLKQAMLLREEQDWQARV